MDIFCSSIIPTVNRPTLSRAVRSVLDQHFEHAGFEVIVINDSGQPLPDMDWQHSTQVRLLNTNRRERSVARNTGAAIARGEYLHFLDDDDVFLPGALESFWDLAQLDSPPWLSGSYQTVDNCGVVIEVIHPQIEGNCLALLTSGEGIPLQASLVKTEQFFRAGVFDTSVVGVEDRDLGRRLALLGNVTNTSTIVANIRIGQLGSTTHWEKLAELDRCARDKVLSDQRAFERLRDSANSCIWHGQLRRSYWHGRVCRAYLASAVRNAFLNNGLAAAARTVSAFALAGLYIFSPDFWRGMVKGNNDKYLRVRAGPTHES